MGFNLIYWTPICSKYFLDGSILEKYGLHRRLWPDWGLKGLGDITLLYMAYVMVIWAPLIQATRWSCRRPRAASNDC